MTGEIQLFPQSEIEEVLSSEADTGQVGINIESPPGVSDVEWIIKWVELNKLRDEEEVGILPRLIELTKLIFLGILPWLIKLTIDLTKLIFLMIIDLLKHNWRIWNALLGRISEGTWNALLGRNSKGTWNALLGRNSEGTWSVERVTLLTAVLGMFSGAVYLALYNFHDAFPISAVFKTANFSTWELLTFSKAATGSFLVITTVTTTFIIGMGANTYAICFVFRKFAWRTFYTILFLFPVAAFSVSFFAMLHKLVPYSITIAGGKIKVSAIFILIFYDIYVIVLVCALACAAQCFSSCWCKQDADVEPPTVV